MKFFLRLLILVIFALAVLPQAYLAAQSDQDSGVSLGDVARALRKDKANKTKEQEKEQGQPEPPSAQTVIDNDNLPQVMAQAEKDRLKGGVNFLFDGIGKDIHVSAPDVTCNLSYSAKASVLVSDPFVPQDIPRNELVKLDGPAVINGEALQITVHNGTEWNVREITVGLTILRQASPSADARYGNARLLPASDGEEQSSGKRSDLTVLYHIKGSAAPGATTVFRQELGGKLYTDQEWHWAIVQAQGIPPK
jgi:hypothetical protein